MIGNVDSLPRIQRGLSDTKAARSRHSAKVCQAFLPDTAPREKRGASEGSVLIIALWVIVILTLLISGFAFDMHIEAGITSYHRKRIKAQYIAKAGVELAQVVLSKSGGVSEEDLPEDDANAEIQDAAIVLSRGSPVTMNRSLGEGELKLRIVPEEGRRNVSKLSDEDWEEILDQANIPEEDWPELIDCFADWVDDDGGLDATQLNGAESDDPFYMDRGYECKNAPIDTVDELVLIKGFTEELVYGGPPENEGDEPYVGIAQWLTVWGDGRVNINTASREVLLTLPDVDEWMVDAIIEGRQPEDDDPRHIGFDSVDEAVSEAGLPDAVKSKICVREKKYVRVISEGDVNGVRSGVWCVLKLDGEKVTPVFWREENAQ